MAVRVGLSLAIQEHILSGHPVTGLEALVLFGISDVSRVVTDLRRSGWKIVTARIPYARAVARINRHTTLTPPSNLPIREILLTEYKLQK